MAEEEETRVVVELECPMCRRKWLISYPEGSVPESARCPKCGTLVTVADALGKLR